jgi:PAS domain S-box-containing protein
MTLQPLRLDGGWAEFRALNANGSSGGGATTDLIAILDTVEVPVVVLHQDTTVAGFNRAAAEVLGMVQTDVGQAATDVASLAVMPRLSQHCREVVTSGVEDRVDLREGDRWFVVRISPHRAADGRSTGTVLTFTNVTAFRASLEQAVYERECTKTILNTVADPLVVLSADLRIQSGNRAFYTLFEVSRDETQGAPLHELGSGEFSIEPVRGQLRRMIAGSDAFQPVEVDHVATRMGKRTLLLDARPLSFPGHAERRVLVTFQDITAHKQAQAAKDLRSEEELRRSETFLAEGQRLSLTGSFSWKPATDEITWSEQLYRIYELEIGEPVTVDLIRTRVHPEDVSLIEKMRQVHQAQEAASDFEWQYRLLMPNQSIKYMHAVGHATRDRDGELEYIASVQDVTSRRVAEDALAKARSELAKVARISSLGVLTASIAHEVNQPLSGIITNAGTCLRMLDADPPNVDGARETARRTIRDGNRASDVIARLRALFSKDELTLEVLDLNEVTREVIALSLIDLQRNRVTVRSELAKDLPALSGDRIQLQQVILNLIRNGSDAMADVQDRPRLLLIKTARDGVDHVRISVRDAGIGVDPGNVNKLLDAFYTTKSDGMGIGLSVSRSIVEKHHGHLWAEPNDGPGATFSFSIPTMQEGVPEAVPR